MPRVFASLAVANLSLFALTALSATVDSASPPDRHILLAVGALLLSCFLEVIGFTYLTVTGKVIAQAVHLASLDAACLQTTKQFKRNFTRLLAIVAVSIVLASATGGAAWRSPAARVVHVPTALLAAIIHVWGYHRQYHLIRRNAKLVDTTLKDYSSWRTRRIEDSLPVGDKAKSGALVE